MPARAPVFNASLASDRLQSFPELTPNPGGVAPGFPGAVTRVTHTQVEARYVPLPEGGAPSR